MIRFRLGICGQESHRSDAVSFLVHPVRNHMMSACSRIGDINFKHLAKEVPARFLHYQVATPPFQTVPYERMTKTSPPSGGG